MATKKELEFKLKQQRQTDTRTINIVDRVTAFGLGLIRWAGIGWVIWNIQLMVGHLAGKETDANILVSGAVDLKFLASRYAAVIVYFLLAFSGVTYGLAQRRLYRKAVKKLQRLEELERHIDPKRSGSGLHDGSQPNEDDIL